MGHPVGLHVSQPRPHMSRAWRWPEFSSTAFGQGPQSHLPVCELSILGGHLATLSVPVASQLAFATGHSATFSTTDTLEQSQRHLL